MKILRQIEGLATSYKTIISNTGLIQSFNIAASSLICSTQMKSKVTAMCNCLITAG